MEDYVNILLSRGAFAKVSPEDHDCVNAHTWSVSPRGHGRRYAVTKIEGKTVYLHRLILNADKDEYVDHVNGDGLDNRRGNIRICTQSQNLANANRSLGKSGARGVHRHGNKWRAMVHEKGKNIYLGSFDNKNDAITARDKAALNKWGAFAVLNETANG